MVELEQPRFICHVTTRVITSLAEAERLKHEGNACFKEAAYERAAGLYQDALAVAPGDAPNRAVYLGNKAACLMRLGKYEETIDACTQALGINETYVKVLMRRSTAYEQINDGHKALKDAKQVLDLDAEHEAARAAVARLEPMVAAQNAAAKEEMMGKLKNLGNTVLGTFGMSLDDFKAEKNPETGSYSISIKRPCGSD